tara:strand:- start:458 stop:604 length:147 start_codon:yes stop_codon:yes gene_type:complete
VFQQSAEFILIRDFFVMLFLIEQIPANGLDVTLAHAEQSLTILPMKFV